MQNKLMSKLYSKQSFAIKKKANYLEKLFCGAASFDNVYKLYEWDKELVTAKQRLVRFQ